MKNRASGGTIVQKPARQPRKKVCDLGRTCPYQEEYQHLMEFSHDCAPATTAARNATSRNTHGSANNGNRLGGTLGFAGGGNRLGGSTEIHRNRNIPVMWEDAIQCEFCSAKVSLAQLATHLAQHEERIVGDSLKNEQDSALEESILLDVQRRSNEEGELRERQTKEREAVEKKEMEHALAISIAELHREERELAAKNLLPEPDADYIDGKKIVLKFTLTDSIKLKRTFRSKNPVTDAFQFLRAQKELEGKQFSLRDAVNTLSLEANDRRSFEAAGVLSNSSLLVVVKSEDVVPVPVSAVVLPETGVNGGSGNGSGSGSGSGSGANSSGIERNSSSSSNSSSNSSGASAVAGVKRPFDALDTAASSSGSNGNNSSNNSSGSNGNNSSNNSSGSNGNNSSSSSSSNSNSSSSSSSSSSNNSSSGIGGVAGGSTVMGSRQPPPQPVHQQQQQVVDLLGESPSPALSAAVRKRPAPPLHADLPQAHGPTGGSQRSNNAQKPQLHTPHRAQRGSETAAVIDLTLS